jgi:site-specific DNA-methyltransferase (adenine-specific)
VKTIPISEVVIPPRQRTSIEPQPLRELKGSILSKGLMHCPLLSAKEDGSLHLVAGERRLTAMRELHEDGHTFLHDAQEVPKGHIPYSLVGDLNLADLAEAELEENLLRADLTFMEQAEARVLIHNLRTQQNPTQTIADTARELSTRSGKTEVAERDHLTRAIEVVKHAASPRVKAAKSLREAHRIILDDQAASFRATLVQLGAVKTDHQVILGDCIKILPTLSTGSFDTILCDPPYGINADEMKKTAKHHYDDSPENAMAVCKHILQQGFRLLKPRGNLFLFCDIDFFLELREYAKQQAFTPFRTPLIWQKGIEGQTPWGKLGFTRTYEICAYFTKGEKGLKGGGPDIKEFKRPPRGDRAHAAEKPVGLLSHLLSISGDIGDCVLDPCCGSGPIFEAATTAKMKATGIEIDPSYHALACARLTKEFEGATGNEFDDTATEQELLA